MTCPDLESYADRAVRFVPHRPATGAARPLRVAPALMNCRTAAALLNRLRFPAEGDSSYCCINVHNPRCPLRYDASRRGWVCADGCDELPMSHVNWWGARLLCRALGARLPTAGEWECFAANNEPGRPYPWGDAPPTHALANYDEYIGGPSEAGRFPASEIGLYDLAGNLSEWCLDPAPQAPGEHIVKGGAWSKDALHLRIGAGRGKWGRLGTTTIGLRPVWDD